MDPEFTIVFAPRPSSKSKDPHMSAASANATPQSRIVEILAGTANGCLTELGYYPGMPQRLQELEIQNARWQSENVKLFQDNRSLTRALRETESQYKNTIHILENNIKTLNQEKNLALKRNEALMAGQSPAYKQLLVEYQKLQGYYNTALHEITLFRSHEQSRGKAQTQSPASAATGWTAMPVPPSDPQPVQVTIPQSQNSHLSSQRVSKTPPVPVGGPSSERQGSIPGQFAPNSNQHSRRSSVADPTSAPGNDLQFSANMQQALSIVSDWRRQNHLPNEPRYSLIPTTHSHSASKPISLSSSLQNVFQQPPPTNTVPDIRLSRGNASSPPTPMIASKPPQSNLFSSASPAEISNIARQLPPVEKVNLASSQETSIQICLPPIETSSEVSAFSLKNELGPLGKSDVKTITSCTGPGEESLDPSDHTAEPTAGDTFHESVSPAEPIEAMTPVDTESCGNVQVISTVQSPMHEAKCLKRPSSAISSVEEQHEQKKQRLEGQESTGTETKLEPLAQRVQDEDEDEDGSSDDGEIELGPDGLRLVEDCLSLIIDDNEQDEDMQICKLCTSVVLSLSLHMG
ncbi:hypothetical protein H0H81_004949 [Sphagnurus paluster]|uniref:Uncharacterized protein n=1 Tax=Sphagnurus paluster TaxID=117069 RepID=A0A9P7FZK9_9AGAR|nr:hypothetical protein H0H81_004949 [Sphagnurus paluster]